MAAKMGRPSKFKPEYVEQARKLCDEGATDADLADFFGVAIRTVANWGSEHPDFLQALKVGKGNADERVKRSLYQKAVGYTFDAVKIFMPANALEPVVVPYREHVPPSDTAGIFWLKNRDRENWRDKFDHEQSLTITNETRIEMKGLDADQLRALASIKLLSS